MNSETLSPPPWCGPNRFLCQNFDQRRRKIFELVSFLRSLLIFQDRINFMHGHSQLRLLSRRCFTNVRCLHSVLSISTPLQTKANRAPHLSLTAATQQHAIMTATSGTRGQREPLQLNNELSKSRSPYVSPEHLLLTQHVQASNDAHLTTGPSAYEQPSRMARMETRDFGAGKEARSTTVCQRWICCVSL